MPLQITLRLEMVDMTAIPPAGAAFVGALTAGILASLIKSKVGYSKNFPDSSIYCDNGSGYVSLQRVL